MEDLLMKSVNKHYFPEKERKELAKEGEAMPDGSFPIRNEQDLKDAIRSVGRAKDPAAAKRWIKKRAKEMGKENVTKPSGKTPDLPAGWTRDASGNVFDNKGKKKVWRD